MSRTISFSSDSRYSNRNALIGSTREARHAGAQQAAIVMNRTAIGTATNAVKLG
jgi:hypothetical protein